MVIIVIKGKYLVLAILLIVVCAALISTIKQMYQQSIEEYAMFKQYTLTFHLLFNYA